MSTQLLGQTNALTQLASLQSSGALSFRENALSSVLHGVTQSVFQDMTFPYSYSTTALFMSSPAELAVGRFEPQCGMPVRSDPVVHRSDPPFPVVGGPVGPARPVGPIGPGYPIGIPVAPLLGHFG